MRNVATARRHLARLESKRRQEETETLRGGTIGPHFDFAGVRERSTESTNLDAYSVLRMSEVPEVEVEFIPSTEMPTELGESAATPVAPAIASAIFAATGARVRHLPISRKPSWTRSHIRLERAISLTQDVCCRKELHYGSEVLRATERHTLMQTPDYNSVSHPTKRCF